MAYEDRVWLAQYRSGTPTDIPLGGDGGFASGLAMFQATAANHADAPLVHYAGTTLSVGRSTG